MSESELKEGQQYVSPAGKIVTLEHIGEYGYVTIKRHTGRRTVILAWHLNKYYTPVNPESDPKGQDNVSSSDS